MITVAAITAIDYHKRTIQTCKQLLKDGNETTCDIILNILEPNVDKLEKKIIHADLL